MGKYYQALSRGTLHALPPPRVAAPSSHTRELHATLPALADSGALVPEPTLPNMPSAIAREQALRDLSERVAPKAAVDNSTRLLVGGCSTGEGVSTITAALAIDLSQRLSTRTLVVDGNLRNPTLHRMFAKHDGKGSVVRLTGALQIQATSWPRLDLASCCFDGDDRERAEALEELGGLIDTYPATIIDLGVVRLDARTLPLARTKDPIVLIVRQGVTTRRELSTSAAALRAANRAVAGVIFNGAKQPPEKPGWRMVQT